MSQWITLIEGERKDDQVIGCTHEVLSLTSANVEQCSNYLSRHGPSEPCPADSSLTWIPIRSDPEGRLLDQDKKQARQYLGKILIAKIAHCMAGALHRDRRRSQQWISARAVGERSSISANMFDQLWAGRSDQRGYDRPRRQSRAGLRHLRQLRGAQSVGVCGCGSLQWLWVSSCHAMMFVLLPYQGLTQGFVRCRPP